MLGKRAKEERATAAANGNGKAATGGGEAAAKGESPKEVFLRWCGQAYKALGKCCTARA